MNAIESIQENIKRHERILSSLVESATDPETWAECGYYLQQDMDAERSYLNVMYRKLEDLYYRSETSNL